MTNANTNAARTSSNGARTEWPQRFGKLKSLQVKSGRNGSYGIITLDCGGKFEQTAFIFKAEALAKAEEAAKKANAAGVTADIWMKGPMEPVERDGVTRDQMKIVYIKDNTDYEAADEQPEPAAEAAPVEPQDLTVLKGIGAAVAEKLTEAGIATYAALAAATAENLDAVAKGYGARATNGDWQGQAAAQVAATEAAAAAEAAKRDQMADEVPF